MVPAGPDPGLDPDLGLQCALMSGPLPDLVLYSRPGCHLCDDAHAAIDALLDERAASGRPVPALVERNIDDDPRLREAFGTTIPVVELGERRLELVTSPGRLRRLLATLDDTNPTTLAPSPTAASTGEPPIR